MSRPRKHSSPTNGGPVILNGIKLGIADDEPIDAGRVVRVVIIVGGLLFLLLPSVIISLI